MHFSAAAHKHRSERKDLLFSPFLRNPEGGQGKESWSLLEHGRGQHLSIYLPLGRGSIHLLLNLLSHMLSMPADPDEIFVLWSWCHLEGM